MVKGESEIERIPEVSYALSARKLRNVSLNRARGPSEEAAVDASTRYRVLGFFPPKANQSLPSPVVGEWVPYLSGSGRALSLL